MANSYFSYSVTDFVPLTTIRSADVNSRFTQLSSQINNATVQGFTDQGSPPATPEAGSLAVYSASQRMKFKNASGTVAILAEDPTTTKGDISVNTGSALARQAVGANGTVLTADSGQTNGIKWGSGPLTTKGDIYTYSSTGNRLAVGTDGQALIADSASTNGIKWDTLFTKWASYTVSNSGWGNTVVAYSARYKRIQDSGVFIITLRLNNAPTGTLQFSQSDFFGNLSLTLGTLPDQTDTQIPIGIWEAYDNGAANYSGGVYVDSASGQIFLQNGSSGTINATSPFTWGNTDSISITTQVIPISQWA